MARIRTIKPQFFRNEQLAECSPMARLMFIGLWTIADKEGRLEDRPKRIKAELFPFDDCDGRSLLDELSNQSLITRYEVAGNLCIQIPNFTKHQRPHPKEVASNIPPVPLNYTASREKVCIDQPFPSVPSDTSFPSELAASAASADLPQNGKSAAATRLPATPSEFVFPTTGKGALEWTLPQEKLVEYIAAYPGLDVSSELRKARQHCRDNPRKRKTGGGMLAFLTRWMNRAQNGFGDRHGKSSDRVGSGQRFQG